MYEMRISRIRRMYEKRINRIKRRGTSNGIDERTEIYLYDVRVISGATSIHAYTAY